MSSPGTLNLDELNRRQEDRLNKILNQEYDFTDNKQNGGKNESRVNPPPPQNEDLKALDTLLFDILKSN